MTLVAGGTFLMGSNKFYLDEGPVHERSLPAFYIDVCEVTNSQYADFVHDTGYVTVAERPLRREDFPGADPATLVPGSMVFTPTSGPTDLNDWRSWWRWQPGAFWRAPFGPGSTIDNRLSHPVVHIAYEDTEAYARWAGKRLPTEAEHEFAARGGLHGAAFEWGDEPYPDGIPRANSWRGRFPYDNQGWGGTSPVGSYSSNGYGLFDMTGNVWEWTSDIYFHRHRMPGRADLSPDHRSSLLASEHSQSPVPALRRVLKGGSHLCSPDYCLRFRPAARSPQTEDTGMSHIGFRCARDA